jgi:hypothetical protein
MMNPFGFGLALAATASLAAAGGDDEKKNNSSRLDRLSASAVPQGGGPTIKAGAGKGITFDMGDEFSLRLSNRIQVKYQFNANDGAIPDINTFSIRRARTAFDGHAFDTDITYKLQLEWTAAPSLLDAWVKWVFWKNENHNSIAVRAGAQKSMHGLESTGSSANLEFVERSLASRTFSDNRVLAALLYGAHGEGQKFTWYAGPTSNGVASGETAKLGGSATNQVNDDNELDLVAGVRFDGKGFIGDEKYEQGDLREAGKQDLIYTVGGGVALGNHRDATGAFDIESMQINVNGAVKVNGWSFQGEVFSRSDDPQVTGGSETDSMGWYVSGSYTLQPQGDSKSRWAFGARLCMVENSDPAQVAMRQLFLGAAEGEVTEIDVTAVNYYRGAHSLKTIFGYTWQDVDFDVGTDLENHIIALLFQLGF